MQEWHHIKQPLFPLQLVSTISDSSVNEMDEQDHEDEMDQKGKQKSARGLKGEGRIFPFPTRLVIPGGWQGMDKRNRVTDSRDKERLKWGQNNNDENRKKEKR